MVPSPQSLSLSQNFGQLVSSGPTPQPASLPEFLSSSPSNDRNQYLSLSQNFGQLVSSGPTPKPASLPKFLSSSLSNDRNQYLSLSQNFGQLISSGPTPQPASLPKFLSSSSSKDHNHYLQRQQTAPNQCAKEKACKKKQRTKVSAPKKQKKEPCQANSLFTPSSGRRAIELKIDRQSPQNN